MFFFFNDTATTEIYTLSLHDALPIYPEVEREPLDAGVELGAFGDARHEQDRHERQQRELERNEPGVGDRKSTRLNSSHGYISYAVFCLKKKNTRTLRYALCVVQTSDC